MKLFEDLDKIISRAVFESMKDEKLIQKNQSSVIDKLDLRASDQNSLDSSVKEAEADEETEIKITGDAEKKPDKKKSNPEEKGTAASKKLKDLSSKQISKPTFRSIADNINLLRGGRSIKDPEVKQNLKDYLSRLDVQEKRQVLIYLNSLAQVMSGVKLGSEVAVDTGQAETKADKKHKTGSSKRSSEVIVVGE